MSALRITATAPAVLPGADEVSSTVTVDQTKYDASPEGVARLAELLTAAVLKRGGDVSRITFTAEPIGPRIRLVAVNGKLL
jgi:hypothetical protein